VGGTANSPGGDSEVDYTNTAFQSLLFQRMQATIDLNVFDGLFFDWWGTNESDASHLTIIKAARDIVGQGLIVVNTNQYQIPNTNAYINGAFMEPPGGPVTDYATLESNMIWHLANLKPPVIILLEQWCNTTASFTESDRTSKPAEMRLASAMAMVFGAYCNYSAPPYTGAYGHVHNWYTFWDKTQSGKTLGTITGTYGTTGLTNGTGYRRDFSGGSVVYNRHASQSMTVDFSSVTHTRASTGATGTSFTLAALDGDIFFL
jgi:hypothetical protein